MRRRPASKNYHHRGENVTSLPSFPSIALYFFKNGNVKTNLTKESTIAFMSANEYVAKTNNLVNADAADKLFSKYVHLGQMKYEGLDDTKFVYSVNTNVIKEIVQAMQYHTFIGSSIRQGNKIKLKAEKIFIDSRSFSKKAKKYFEKILIAEGKRLTKKFGRDIVLFQKPVLQKTKIKIKKIPSFYSLLELFVKKGIPNLEGQFTLNINEVSGLKISPKFLEFSLDVFVSEFFYLISGSDGLYSMNLKKLGHNSISGTYYDLQAKYYEKRGKYFLSGYSKVVKKDFEKIKPLFELGRQRIIKQLD